MRKQLTKFTSPGCLRICNLVFLLQVSLCTAAQFQDYNGKIRTLNYYMLHMEHLLVYHEQTTFLMQGVNAALVVKDDNAVQQQVSTHSNRVNVQDFQAYIARANEGISEDYNVKNFIAYHQRSKYLPDSLSKVFKQWIKKADSIALVQNTIANDVMKLLARFNLSSSDKMADFKTIHSLIKQYHSNLSALQIIRNGVTRTSLQFYKDIEAKKKYPFAIYKRACEYFLQVSIHLNNYFEYADQQNEELAVTELRKLNDEIQGYLANEYTYRTYNNQLPGFHVFPLEEDAHNEISYTFKEMSFEINRYFNSGRTEKIDSVFFRKKTNEILNIIHAISFSHDMNLNVQNSNDVPERYHASLKAILRFDFLRPRYDLYHNAGGNSTTSAMPLAWCRYVYTFNYTEPEYDSVTNAPLPEIKPVDAPLKEMDRETLIMQTIQVDTDSVTLAFYDNAEIDSDTVTVLVNGSVQAGNIELKLTPYQFSLKMDKVNNEKIVTIFANNLGTIPPNTAYVRVTAGDKIYRLYLFATKKTNAAFKIIYRQNDLFDQ